VVFAQEGHGGGEVGVQKGVREIFQAEAKALFTGGCGAGASVAPGLKKAFAECEAVWFFVGVAEDVAVTVNDSNGKIEDALWKRLTWLNVGIHDDAEGLVLEQVAMDFFEAEAAEGMVERGVLIGGIGGGLIENTGLVESATPGGDDECFVKLSRNDMIRGLKGAVVASIRGSNVREPGSFADTNGALPDRCNQDAHEVGADAIADCDESRLAESTGGFA
jgi:hypothetical protein